METDYKIWAVKMLVLLALFSSLQTQANGTGATEEVYDVELARWNIYNDGTHPKETTDGMNRALQYASEQRYNVFQVPAGTYLIAKGQGARDASARINMVSNMTFRLNDKAVIQKESNADPGYMTMYIGPFVHDVTLEGGTYRGDRDTHDYASGGTHEGGYGIMTAGSQRVIIDGVKSERFTGDGLMIGGHGAYFHDVYENAFESGTLNEMGQPIPGSGKIRMRNAWALTDASFAQTGKVVIDNLQHLPAIFDMYFYTEEDEFVGKLPNQTRGQYIDIPVSAKKFKLTFETATFKQAYLEIWNKVQSRDIIVRHSEFAFNRRQGITVGGADNVLIIHNSLHDQSGTAPESGIDVEGGAGENGYINSYVMVKNNTFYNNRAYDVILYDGHDAIVEGNHMGSTGAIGLAVSQAFTGAQVVDNTFDGTRIYAYHDVHFKGNRMNDSHTFLAGPNLTIEDMTFTDSLFAINSVEPFGVTVSNVLMINNKKSESGLSIWGKPVHLTNVTIRGESTLRSIRGGVEEGSIFDNLEIIGYNAVYGLDLPRGTYRGCVFEASPNGRSEPAVNQSGNYTFDSCNFRTDGTGLGIYHPDAEVTVRDSSFDISGNAGAIFVSTAKSVNIENNKVSAMNLKSTGTQLIGIGDYWKRQDPSRIGNAAIKGNTVRTNIAAMGISTIYAGAGAPPYVVEDNVLYNAKLFVRETDFSKNNEEFNDSLQ